MRKPVTSYVATLTLIEQETKTLLALGYVFTINGGAICWRLSKQKSVAKSTTEAEYMALSDASQEAV